MLDLRHISYKTQLKELSTTFFKGKIYGLLGSNGAGKTTLLKNIAGLWPLSSGQILYQNREYLKKERRVISRLVSYVSQTHAIAFDFTVFEIVSMSAYCHLQQNSQKLGACIELALTQVDMWHLRAKKITQLSSGEKQRVFIARALAVESPILLLDEPTNCLDIRHQLEIWELLGTFSDKIIIVATHDIKAAVNYCDDLVLIKSGFCIDIGCPKKILTNQRLQDVFGLQNYHLESLYSNELRNK